MILTTWTSSREGSELKGLLMMRSGAGADPSSIRRWNEFTVVAALRERGPMRVSQLSQATGLTAAPLGEVLVGLQDKGWVSVQAVTAGERGRPAKVYGITMLDACVLGVDVGGHMVRAVLVAMDNSVRGSHEIELDVRDEQERCAAVRTAVARCVAEAKTSEIWACGVAVGGYLSEEGEVIRSVAIPEWEGRHPDRLLAPHLPMRPMLVNDVRAAVWAEHVVGVAQGYNDVLLVSLGRRPTLGLLLGGAPHAGAQRLAGDMSRHSSMPDESSMHWLERYSARSDALGDAVRDALAGDAASREAIRSHVAQIGPQLALAASVIDPEVVILSGAMARAAEIFLGDLTAQFEENLQRAPRIEVSTLDQFAPARGAALLTMRHLMDAMASPVHGLMPLGTENVRAVLDAEESPMLC